MSRRPRYSEADVRAAVAGACNLTEALRTLGLRPAGGNHQTLRKLIERYRIPIEHFGPGWMRRETAGGSSVPLEEVLVEGSTYSRKRLKQRLYESGLKPRRCELCGQGELWRGASMSLILDHINGEPTDNRIGNLRVVCPNCAATLDTHCGRKNRADVEPRRCLRCQAEFRPNRPGQRYCSRACGVRSRGSRSTRLEARKVDRPTYEQLRHDLAAMSFLAVGRKYGVSDNAVRKWLRWYEADGECGQAA